jgi:hypothetical protein
MVMLSSLTGSKRLAAKVFVAAGSAVLTLAVAELLLRLVYPIGRLTYRIDDDRLFALVPASSRVYVHYPIDGGGFTLSNVNRHGFRGPELRSRDAFRILVFGDSFVHAEFSDWSESFTGQLEAQMAKGSRTVEVVNAGIRAYGPDQALIYMEQILPTIAPDLVVFSGLRGQ